MVLGPRIPRVAGQRWTAIRPSCESGAAKQAAVLGVCRATAWVVLNRDKRAGPSAKVIKRILSSPQVPKNVRLKIEQYVRQKTRGLYGHRKAAVRSFRDQFRATTL